MRPARSHLCDPVRIVLGNTPMLARFLSLNIMFLVLGRLPAEPFIQYVYVAFYHW